MNIYVASSWRNALQPAVVAALRCCRNEVYDFRHPSPGNQGFSWSEIDPAWKDWTPDEYRRALEHDIAVKGHGFDLRALEWCHACVLVLPSGRSASWELGYAMGQGKRAVVAMFEPCEPELMYRGAEIVTSLRELVDAFGEQVPENVRASIVAGFGVTP